MNSKLETERIIMKPFNDSYLPDFYIEFTEEITRYQYPDPFKSLEDAREFLDYFVDLMNKGKMLELVITTKEGEYLGSIEAHGLDTEYPEVGLWLKSSAHGKGFGYEALKCMIDYLNSKGLYKGYLYEADKRNLSSIHLVNKFNNTEEGYEEFKTESGKLLFLKQFKIIADN